MLCILIMPWLCMRSKVYSSILVCLSACVWKMLTNYSIWKEEALFNKETNGMQL